jgi:3-oxoadipate enol-lactonase
VPTAAVDRRTLHYEVVGDGPAVVLIHSAISDSSLWDPQIEALRHYYRVLRYDVPGYGRSPLAPGPYSHLRDLRALLAHVGIERAALVGSSMGGRIALEFAIAHPETVEKLVLLAPGLGGHEWSAEPQRADDEETERYEAGDFDGAAESQVRIWVDGPRRRPDEVDGELRERARRMIRRSYELYAEVEKEGNPGPVEWLDPPAIARLGDVAVPTLIVVGEHEVSDMFEIAALLEAGIPGARKVIVEGTAHLLPLEQPEELERLLLDFLGAA